MFLAALARDHSQFLEAACTSLLHGLRRQFMHGGLISSGLARARLSDFLFCEQPGKLSLQDRLSQDNFLILRSKI